MRSFEFGFGQNTGHQRTQWSANIDPTRKVAPMTDTHPYKNRRSALWHPLWLIAALLTVCVVAGCESARSTRTTRTTMRLDEGGVVERIDGLRIEIDETVEYELRTYSESGSQTTMSRFLNGWTLTVAPDHFTLGEHRFDGIERGDTLRFSTDGIALNGTRRWDWPHATRAE